MAKNKEEKVEEIEKEVETKISFFEFLETIKGINVFVRDAYIRKFGQLESKSINDWNKLVKNN